ncbi:MAG: hypothetical protein IJO33_00915 [Bacilli bacterium]|nr:hypothetical protein [Bacilli bacterium]
MAKQCKKNSKKHTKKICSNRCFLIAILFTIIIFALIVVIFSSYALWNDTKVQEGQNLISTGCFSVTLTDNNEDSQATSISLINTYPISDVKGQNLKPYQFTITNTCNINAQYRIALSSLSNSTLNPQYIKYLFNNINNTDTIKQLSTAPTTNLDNETLSIINSKNDPYSVSSSYLMEEESLNAGESKTFNLRLWMSIEADNSMMNKGFYGVVSVTSVSAN